ncbi:MAG: hypothetical protein LBH32_07150 [Dysgonamonadaceae bacterium]|jgi:hypothetical protein|nr:hypothetical protein [Dysgonamonadaceae bacterium]
MDIDNSFYSYNAECHKCKLEGKQYRFPLTEDITDIEKEIIRKIQNNEVKL